ncbi:MAG: hypothetical protein QXS81_01225 [Candidatus Micrarchaeaceae archaeon]
MIENIKEGKYLKPDEVEEVMKFMPKIPVWHKYELYGLKFKYIKLQRLFSDWEFSYKKRPRRIAKEITVANNVYLIRTAKGYAISFEHGYVPYGDGRRYFELPELVKNRGLWSYKPNLWDKICKQVSL